MCVSLSISSEATSHQISLSSLACVATIRTDRSGRVLLAAMEELVAWQYFGFHPNRLYGEIYAVGYNEFLCAVSALREALLAEFPEPERQREVQDGCDQLLASYSRSLDQKWFHKFVQYCSSNVFTVPAQVSVYGDIRRDGGAVDEVNHQLLATLYLNFRLQQRIDLLDR